MGELIMKLSEMNLSPEDREEVQRSEYINIIRDRYITKDSPEFLDDAVFSYLCRLDTDHLKQIVEKGY